MSPPTHSEELSRILSCCRSCSRCGSPCRTLENSPVRYSALNKTSHFQAGGEEEEDNQPLDLSWPDTFRERVTYLSFLPIIIPLWLTLPDTRKESGQREHPPPAGVLHRAPTGLLLGLSLQIFFNFHSKYLLSSLFTQIFSGDLKINWAAHGDNRKYK